ncbi:hypothetical protein QL285_085054 [Trifolium repens]|nr:hypothetical protein QL285_085054 [Trifolium repens]
MSTSKKKSLLMMAMVFMVALYYLVLVLMIIMLQFQIKSFLPFMVVIILLGSVVSFLALMIISPMIAWIDLGLWILIFALMCYKNRKELYQMIPKRFKTFIESSSGSGNIGISTHNLEIPRIESLPV